MAFSNIADSSLKCNARLEECPMGCLVSKFFLGTLDVSATVIGQVQGSFFGPQAAAVGGVSDITKSYNEGELTALNVDLFIANKVSD